MGDQHGLANKVTFAFVAASAGAQALQQALKDAPDLVRTIGLPDMNVGGWNYVPLVLVMLGVFVSLVERARRASFAPVDASSAKTVSDAFQVEADVGAETQTPMLKPTQPPRKRAPAKVRAITTLRPVDEPRVFVSPEEYEATLERAAGMTSDQAALELKGLTDKWRTLK